MKIALFGAGSAQFGYGTLGDIFQSKYLKGAEIALMDINPKTLNRVYQTASDHIKTHELPYSLTATTDRRDALKGADFVIISIEIGDRFELWDMDWKIPQQFGVSQVYGENGGPGGIFHSLRITPAIIEICDEVMEICPEAVVFNYSNPMTAITTAVLRKYPSCRFVGMCHEVASLKRNIPTMLDTPLEKLKMRPAGLNHFSVLLEAEYLDTGKDAYKDIMDKAPAYFEREPGFSEVWDYTRRTGIVPHTEGAQDRWQIDIEKSFRPWSDRALFKVIMDTYGLLPITTDSHMGEYIAWAGDAVDHQGILDFYSFYRRALAENSWSEITSDTRERVAPIMDGIVGDIGYEEMAVNVMNNGAVPVLPDDIAVEVPAVIDRHGLTPIRFESYPRGFGALLRNYAGVYDLTVEAILNRDKGLVLQAILACPGVHHFQGMERMMEMMFDYQRDWLGYLS